MSSRKDRRSGKPRSYIPVIITAVVLFIGALCFLSARWYVRIFGRIGFDSILFTLTGGMGGVSGSLISSYLLRAVLPAFAVTAGLCLLFFWPFPKIAKSWPLGRKTACVILLLVSLGMIVFAAFDSQLVDYVLSFYLETDLYHGEYQDPADAKISFPQQKRNLVYILLESMETSYLSKEQNGALDYNLIPELYDLAKENINFSESDTVGGFRMVSGASWTVGAMVAQTAGIPLQVPGYISDWQNGYGKDGNFLPGATTLMDILHENGYYQALMVGSVASFGGRDVYYSTHGVDQIYELGTAYRDGIVPDRYWNGWWGMEDLYLYEYAKQELTEIAQKDQPFAFTLLTVDTHHIGGFICELCGSDHEESYENAIRCASRQAAAFVAWLQQQPFYENTTVIITGDHCSMDAGYFERNVEPGYTRRVFNCFLNCPVQPVFAKNREFCAIDMFPTTLASLGCTIEGDRLGLGTNLFSARSTLLESRGYARLCNELIGDKRFYSSHFYSSEDQARGDGEE